MDTRQLAAFCAVVERRSFSQAAEQLGVTQPAVSLQIRSLEKRLGVQLLDRSGRRVEPTEPGRRLYRSAQRLLAVEEQLLAELGEELLLLGEQPLCAPVQPLARLGRLDPAAGAVEQLSAEALLERADLQADGRLGHPELLRRLREAPPLDDGAEGSELPRIHISQAYLCVLGQAV